MAEEEDLVAIYIICLIVIILLALPGSIFSIYFYAKQKPIKVGGLYIIALAIMDMFAALFVAPQFLSVGAFIKVVRAAGYEMQMNLLFVTSITFLVVAYLFVLTAIALDRAYAVFCPFRYRQSISKTLTIIISLVVLSVLISTHSIIMEWLLDNETMNFGSFVSSILVFLICAAFVTLFLSYMLIIYKLRTQRIKVTIRGRQPTIPRCRTLETNLVETTPANPKQTQDNDTSLETNVAARDILVTPNVEAHHTVETTVVGCHTFDTPEGRHSVQTTVDTQCTFGATVTEGHTSEQSVKKRLGQYQTTEERAECSRYEHRPLSDGAFESSPRRSPTVETKVEARHELERTTGHSSLEIQVQINSVLNSPPGNTVAIDTCSRTELIPEAPQRRPKTKMGNNKENKIRRKEIKAIKIFLGITILYVVSFIPSVLTLIHVNNTFLLTYTYFINHFGNAFICYMVDEVYKKKVNRLVIALKCW